MSVDLTLGPWQSQPPSPITNPIIRVIGLHGHPPFFKRDCNQLSLFIFFLNRYFQSRPEIFANLSDGSQGAPATAAVSAAMHRGSDVMSKMVSTGLRNAAATSSNNASRPSGGDKASTTVSFPLFFDGGSGREKRNTRTCIIFFFSRVFFFLLF